MTPDQDKSEVVDETAEAKRLALVPATPVVPADLNAEGDPDRRLAQGAQSGAEDSDAPVKVKRCEIPNSRFRQLQDELSATKDEDKPAVREKIECLRKEEIETLVERFGKADPVKTVLNDRAFRIAFFEACQRNPKIGLPAQLARELDLMTAGKI